MAAGAAVALVPAAARKIEPRRVVYKLAHPSPENLETAIAWRREDKSPMLAEFIGVARRTLPGCAHGAARTDHLELDGPKALQRARAST